MAQTLPPSSNRSHTFHSFVTPEVTPEGSPVSQRISDSRTPFHPTPNENSRRRLLNDFFKILASWVRLVWLDFLVLLFILFLAWLFDSRIRVFRQHNRTFPMWLEPPDRWYGPPSISQPRQQLIVSNLVAAMVVTAVPVVVFLMTQIIIRDFWDANAAIFGLLKGLALMFVFQIILFPLHTYILRNRYEWRCLEPLLTSYRTFIQTALKLLFGAFRPHFLDVCRPDPVKLRYLHSAREPFKGGPIWATISVCQGSPSAVKAAMQSFPSGHSASVLTAGVFLALYLNAKLKAFSNYQTRFWKMILVIMPVVGAICAAGLLLVDGVSLTLHPFFTAGRGRKIIILIIKTRWFSRPN